jgi:hypothetical protein
VCESVSMWMALGGLGQRWWRQACLHHIWWFEPYMPCIDARQLLSSHITMAHLDVAGGRAARCVLSCCVGAKRSNFQIGELTLRTPPSSHAASSRALYQTPTFNVHEAHTNMRSAVPSR